MALLGALFPVALRVGVTGASLAGLALLDALVTRPLAAGVYLAFRFYEPSAGFNSPSALSVGFPLPIPVSPGDVLRVKAGPSGTGTALQLVRYGTQCDAASVVVTALAETDTVLTPLILGWSCFLYSVPPARQCCTKLEAIAAVGATAPALQFMPPPSVLPCQFAVAPASDTLPSGARVAYARLLNGSPGASAALPGDWPKGAWQALRFGPWAYSTDGGNIAFDTGVVAELESAFYVAPLPGALLPVAVRPHFVGVPGTAQLALVVTQVIPAGTQVLLSADPTTDAVPQWQWTAPTTYDVKPGTVLLWSGLCLLAGYQTPAANIGTLQYVGDPAAPDADLTDFVVFTAACASRSRATYRNITAVYTCARPTGDPLPEGLSAGRDMPSSPWPASASILPLNTLCCSATVPFSAWPCLQITLCNLRPVAWSCQELPHFCSPACGPVS